MGTNCWSISWKRLRVARWFSAKSGKSFGECAVDMRLVTRKQLDQALGLQFAHQVPMSGKVEAAKDAVVAHEPFGTYSESMRTIASRLMQQWWSPTSKTLAVVSSAPGEGRSHVAANLAIAFAHFGHRTLLVDADMRNPRQHTTFKVPLHPGLSRFLCGQAPEDSVRSVSFLDKLMLITAGPTPPNAVEVLSRPELDALLRHAQRSFDVIVLDTPASAAWQADTEIIAKAAGSALIIGAKNQSRVRALNALRKKLADAGVKIAGFVMNAT